MNNSSGDDEMSATIRPGLLSHRLLTWRLWYRVGLVLVVAASIAIMVFHRIASLQPQDFAIESQATVEAPPERVYAALKDVAQAPLWLPWEEASRGVVTSDPLPRYTWTTGYKKSSVTLVHTEVTNGQYVILMMQDYHDNRLFWNVAKINIVPAVAGPGSLVTVTLAAHRNWRSRFLANFQDQSRAPMLRLNQQLEKLKLSGAEKHSL